jgi:uncharacterized protein (DUF169 family)
MESNMTSPQQDLVILEKFNFDVKPVTASFLIRPPERVPRLEAKMTFCQMIRRAQEGEPFYADSENHACEVGPFILGGQDIPPPFFRGEYGVAHKHFREPRAMRRIYRIIPKLEKNVVSCVAFSTVDQLSIEPDVIIFVADFDQTQILLRAMSYTTGQPYTSKFTGVMGCAWLFIYPYLTGKLNYVPANFSAGMKLLKVFRDGTIVTSIPYQLLPTVLRNLQEMPWILPLHQADGEEFRERLRRDLGIDG